MEVRKLVQLVAMLACSSVYAEIALDSPDRRIAAFATHFVEPTQWEDQNYWRDHWSVATVVFDLDGDGVCDALVCTPDEQASTYLGWLPIHQVSGFDCFDTVQLLDHLVWKFEAQLVSRGYKKSSFKEIGTNFLEMQNNLKRLLEANTWGMVLCPTARVYMK